MTAIAAVKPNQKPTKPQQAKPDPATLQYKRIVEATDRVRRLARDMDRLFEADKSEQWGEQVEEVRDAAKAGLQALDTCVFTWAQMQSSGYQPPVLGEYVVGQQVWARQGEQKRMLELYTPAELADLEVVRVVGKKWLVLKIRKTGQTMHVGQGQYTTKEPRA